MIERIKQTKTFVKDIDWSFIKRIDKKTWGFVAASFAVILIYVASKIGGGVPEKVMVERQGEFKHERVLGDPYSAINKGRERRFDRNAKEYTESQKSVVERLDQISTRMMELEGKLAGQAPIPAPASVPQTNAGSTLPTEQGLSSPSASNNTVSPHGDFQGSGREPVDLRPVTPMRQMLSGYSSGGYEARPQRGPAVISFPVPGQEQKERSEIALPLGSYVKAKMLTGVEAPEGTPYPVLLQLDFAHILPNRKSLDLHGCFMIAKAQGDLSTERVQMQATKLSCVARNGDMFERDVNGFVADAVDNSFAVIGEVNSKQDRVAAMAFLSSVVEGVGKAIQMAQTSEQTSADGTTKRILTGDQQKFITAGGASNAAGMVAQWYLKQAQNLLPTINIGSGQDVWIVMNESVSLPQNYFRVIKTGANNEKDLSIVNRLLE
jgi:hypothetical protein